MAMNTGHVFDFFAAPGGIAVPLYGGLEQNPSLKGIPGAPFYTSWEMNVEHHPFFEKSMQGKHYLLLKNTECYTDSSKFDTAAFLTATAPTLEIMTQDPDGAPVEAFIASFVNYAMITEGLPNLRYHLIQEHPDCDNVLMKNMEQLVKEKKWTRVWYSHSWFKWSDIFATRQTTNYAVYAKGHMPEEQVHDIQEQW